MSRIQGNVGFISSYEIQNSAPLDARQWVQYQSDLTGSTTFGSKYSGMTVSVYGDTGSTTNNGVYYFKGGDSTVFSNWVKLLDSNSNINSNALSIPTTTGSTYGVILQNNVPIFQSYGINNLFFGVLSGNFSGITGQNNTAYGGLSLTNITTANNNAVFGTSGLYSNVTGNTNTAFGNQAGFNSLGSGNLFLGFQSGYKETGSNKLYISNTATTTPLIYGQFDNNLVVINNILSATTISGGTFYGNGSNLTGIRDTYVTGGTYNNGVITFTNNSGNTFTVSGLYTGYTDNGQYLFLSGGTLTGTLYGTSISATTISGGTFYGNGSGITGLTQQQINVALGYTPYNSTNPNRYITGYTDTFVTGGTYSNGTVIFTNNTGGTFNVSGFTTPFTGGIVTGLTATTISGGTYYGNASGVTLTTSQITTALGYTPYNSTNPNGYITGYTDTYVTGLTYSSNTLTLLQNNGQQNISVNINNFTGLTINGILSATTISGGTFYGNGSNLTGIRDTYVTGGTYSAGTATFTNNTGGTFNVSGFTTGTTAGGLNSQIQFNNNGLFSGSTGLTWNNTNNRLGIGTSNPLYNLHLVTTDGTYFYGSSGSNYFSHTQASDNNSSHVLNFFINGGGGATLTVNNGFNFNSAITATNVNSNGTLTIGPQSTDAILSLLSNNGYSQYITFRENGNYTSALLGTSTGFQSSSNGSLQFRLQTLNGVPPSTITSGQLVMELFKTGNVGIGTNNIDPKSLLSVTQPTTGIGTVTTLGTIITGLGTQFTNTFKVGDTISLGSLPTIWNNSTTYSVGQSVSNGGNTYIVTTGGTGGTGPTGISITPTQFPNGTGPYFAYNVFTILTVTDDTHLTTTTLPTIPTAINYNLIGGTVFSAKGNGNITLSGGLTWSPSTGTLQVTGGGLTLNSTNSIYGSITMTAAAGVTITQGGLSVNAQSFKVAGPNGNSGGLTWNGTQLSFSNSATNYNIILTAGLQNGAISSNPFYIIGQAPGGVNIKGGSIYLAGGNGGNNPGDIILGIDTSNKVAGNVSIGTSTVSSLFQVYQPLTGVGTVSISSGSTILTGTNTQFTNTFKINDTITISGTTYTITSITSDTSLGLSTAAVTGLTGQSYTLTGGNRFSVKGNGNVLIGTTIDNGTKLQVSGDTYVSGSVSATTISGGTFYGNGANITGIAGTINGLTSSQVVFANSSTTITGSTGFTWNITGQTLSISGSSTIQGTTGILSIIGTNTINAAQPGLYVSRGANPYGPALSADLPARSIAVFNQGSNNTYIHSGAISNTGGLTINPYGGDITLGGTYNSSGSAVSIYGNGSTHNTNSFSVWNNFTPTFRIFNITSGGNVSVGGTGNTVFQVYQPITGIGTVTITSGSTTVTGTNTQFTNTFKINDTITISGTTYTITGVTSDTSLGLSTPAAVTGLTGQSYTLTGGNRFSVKGNGNVLIGTTNDNGTKLQISGDTYVSGSVSATTYYGDGSHLTGISGGGTFTGGTVSGPTTFISGLTANTISLTSVLSGFIPNKMTNAQRTALGTPPTGTIVYCTDATEGLYLYKSFGWVQIA